MMWSSFAQPLPFSDRSSFIFEMCHGYPEIFVCSDLGLNFADAHCTPLSKYYPKFPTIYVNSSYIPCSNSMTLISLVNYSLAKTILCVSKRPLHELCTYQLIGLTMYHVSADSLTAMETWVVGCLIFVFFALVEYGIVLKMVSSSAEKTNEIEDQLKAKKTKKRKQQTIIGALQVWQGKNEVQQLPSTQENKLNVTNTEAMADQIVDLKEETENKTHKADKVAMVVLPLLFLIFNIYYWVKYYAF